MAQVQPAAATPADLTAIARPAADTTGTALWNTFVRRVEAGEVTDPLGQYVSKAQRVAGAAGPARQPRPKFPATQRTLASIRLALAGKSPLLAGGRTAAATNSPIDYPTTEPGDNPWRRLRACCQQFYQPQCPAFEVSALCYLPYCY